MSCQSTVVSGYASITLSALGSDYASLAAEVSEGDSIGQPVTLTAPPETSYLAVTFYGEGSSMHDDCVLTAAQSNPPPPPPVGGGVVVTAEEFYGTGGAPYPWSNLEPGTTVNLVGNFQAGIRLTSKHSGLIFDGGHTIDGVDGWIAGAVLDGIGYATPDYHAGAIRVEGAENITVQNFKIANYRSQTNLSDPKAIFVLGYSRNVVIQSNEVFGFTSVHQPDCHTTGENLDLCGTAHGILVSTEGATEADSSTISDVGIYSNRIYNMDLGKSEALTVKGDVQGFNVKFNKIYDTNNIGIDIAGYVAEGVFLSTRSGVVEGNTVYNVDTRGSQGYVNGVPANQAYVNVDNGNHVNQSAACIYVDGGRDVRVVANRVSRCNIGISINGEMLAAQTLGSESAQNVIVEGNLVYDSSTTGFKLGAGSSDQAGVEGCDVRNNAFYTNDDATRDAASQTPDVLHDGIGEIWVENAVRNCTVRDNDFLGNAIRPDTQLGEKTVFTNTFIQPGPGATVFTNNRFYYQDEPSADTARCQWIEFANKSMTDCLALLNNGGGGNVYTPISKPDLLELPIPRNY